MLPRLVRDPSLMNATQHKSPGCLAELSPFDIKVTKETRSVHRRVGKAVCREILRSKQRPMRVRRRTG
jgi:hypothetical protein